MNNREIAALFDTVADMLAIRGDAVHRILAYRKAAESIRGLGRSLTEYAAEGSLESIPNIGKTLAAKIEEMLAAGRLEFYERLSQEIPPSLVEMLRVEGLGPKKVKLVFDQLAIRDLAGLEAAARQGRLRDLPGMGAKSEANILAKIEALQRHGATRFPLDAAWTTAQAILSELAQLPGITRTAVGGSLRRMRETIGDIDLLVAVATVEAHAPAIMEHFVHLPVVESISGQGPTKSHVTLLSGVGVDLRVLPTERWGTLLSYFTGSKDHNVRLREMALKQGLSLNEYAFTPLDGGAEILCADEAEVYARLGLPFIPPTLREDRGEIEAALAGRLPVLLQQSDIAADLHTHSTWSDGQVSIETMARAAQTRGLRYLVVSDHSRSLGIANGLSIERLQAQAAEVRAVNERLGPDFRVLHGVEMEIKADGGLDYPDEVLAELDVVIASLHVGLSQPSEQVTRRALAAIDNPHVDILGHPTGRLMPDRAGADLDMGAILLAASATGTILEINSNPRRLDLSDIHARRAMELGVKLAVNTDAHAVDDLAYLQYGVATAQRGWVSAESVVNTWPLDRFLAYLRRHDG